MATNAAQANALFVGASAPIQCRVHPVVVFTILDHYVRRNEGQERVIGTLLGVITEGNVLEIRNCFPVPHLEKAEEVLVDQEFHRSMYNLHQKVNPKEVVVGWYATGTQINEHSCLIHEFYGNKEQSLFAPQAPLLNPLHLLVDTEATNNDLAVKAFMSVPLVVADKLAMFQEVPTEIHTQEAEKLGMDMLVKAMNGASVAAAAGEEQQPTLMNDMDTLQLSVQKLADMLDAADQYVDKVLKKEIPGSAQIGRMLVDTLSSIPKIDPEAFDRMFNNSLQDILMVVYLSNLTRTQVLLTEKLNAMM